MNTGTFKLSMPFTRNSHQMSISDDLFLLEQMIGARTKKYGLTIKNTSRSVESLLQTMHLDALLNARFTLSTLLSGLEAAERESINPWDDKDFFRITMRELRLSYPSDLLDRIEEGDVVEAYDTNRRQIFRNMRFMEASSYSLLEVLSYDWPALFTRPPQITEMIIATTEDIIWKANSTMKADVPKHLIRELRSREPQTVEVTFKIFAPLFSGPNQRGGFVCACKGVVIAPAENSNLSFI